MLIAVFRRRLREGATFEDFIAAVRAGRRPSLDGHEGRKAVAIIEACYKSARTGRFALVAEAVGDVSEKGA